MAKSKKAINVNGGGLSERAMLVRLSICYWVFHRKDKTVTEEVAAAKRADLDAGKWETDLIPASRMNKILAVRGQARATHFNMTLPWLDNGLRILPASVFMDYTKKMREHEALYSKAIEELVAEWPELLAGAQKRLGKLFRPEAYPSASDLRTRFRWRVGVTPMPEAGDFRVDLQDDVVADVKADIEKQVQEACREAMSDLWQRLYEAVTHIAERLTNAKGIFRDSLISNVKELCDMLPKLNILNDPALEGMRQEILKGLASEKPEELRTNEKQRTAAAKKAQDIVEKMKGLMKKGAK